MDKLGCQCRNLQKTAPDCLYNIARSVEAISPCGEKQLLLDYTWRIIPVSKWLVTPIYKPFRPFIRGITLPRGLTITMVINHVSKSWDDPPSTYYPPGSEHPDTS